MPPASLLLEERSLRHAWKMEGCGNDFIISWLPEEPCIALPEPRWVQRVCDRHFGVGADGWIGLKPTGSQQAQWYYFNSDGSPASFCGNGARCAALALILRHRLLQLDSRATDRASAVNPLNWILESELGTVMATRIANSQGSLITPMPSLESHFRGWEPPQEVIRLGLPECFQPPFHLRPVPVRFHDGAIVLATPITMGVPHLVVESHEEKTTWKTLGASLAAHPLCGPQGCNVTFFAPLGPGKIRAATYERGVNDLTLSCGSGALAAAVAYRQAYATPFPCSVSMPGGTLLVTQDNAQLALEGPAHFISALTLGWPSLPQ